MIIPLLLALLDYSSLLLLSADFTYSLCRSCTCHHQIHTAFEISCFYTILQPVFHDWTHLFWQCSRYLYTLTSPLSHIFTTMSIFWRDGRNKYKARGGPKHFTLIISLLLDPRSQCPSLLASQQLSSIFNNPLHHKLCLAVTSLHLTFYNCFCSLHSGLIKTQMPNKIKKVFNFNNVKEKDNYEQLPTKLTKITLFNMVVKCKELLNTPI